MPDVLVVFTLEIGEIDVLYMFAGMASSKRKEDVIDECDRRRCTFDVEENAAYWHAPVSHINR